MKSAAVIFVVIVACVQSAHPPENFKRCNRKDPEAKKCFKEAAQTAMNQLTKGYPRVNLPNFEPLEVTELKIGAGSQGVVNVDQNFKNCKLYGISEAKVEDFGFNFDEKYVYATAVVPNLKKLCEYEIDGKILVLPVVGKGPSTVVLKNVKVTLRFDYTEVKRKGKTYMDYNKQKLTLEPETISYNFENLFNGDKALGENINKVLNENPKEVFSDVKEGYENGIGMVLLQILHNFFAKVSMEEAFD